MIQRTFPASWVSKILLFFTLSLLSFNTASATGTKTVTRGDTATINWSVTGSVQPGCTASTDYPVTSPVDDGWKVFWTGSKTYASSPHSGPVYAPQGSYTFTCADATPGATPDSTTLIVNDCPNGTTWSGTACVANSYTITASASVGGSISPSGSVAVAYNGSQTFTFTANPGYTLTSLTVDGSQVAAQASYTFSSVTGAHSITANYTADCTPTSLGSCSVPQTHAGSSVNGNYCATGYSGTCSATCNASGSWVAGANNCSINTFNINVSAGTGGTMSPAGPIVSANYGSTPTFTATANTGYTIASILVDSVSVGAGPSYTFPPITGGHNISATFTANSCAVTTQENCSLPLTGSGSSGGSCASGYFGSCSYSCTAGAWSKTTNTCAAYTVSVVATTPLAGNPGSNVSFAYTPTTNSGTTQCRLLDFAHAPLTSYQAASPIVYAAPNGVSSYAYYVQCRNVTYPPAEVESNQIVLTTTCPNGTGWDGSACVGNVDITDFHIVPPTTVNYNGSATLSWTVSGGSPVCTISNNMNGNIINAAPGSGGSVSTGAVTSTITYTLNCHNASSNDTSDPVVLHVKPTVTLNPVAGVTIIQGNSTTLNWTSQGASSCSASWTAKTGTADNQSVSPRGDTNNPEHYQMNCTSATGDTGASNIVDVTVIIPSATISAVPARVLQGGNTDVLITWNSTDVQSCVVTGPLMTTQNTKVSDTNAPIRVRPVTKSVYTIDCTTASGEHKTNTATVNIVPNFQQF